MMRRAMMNGEEDVDVGLIGLVALRLLCAGGKW